MDKLNRIAVLLAGDFRQWPRAAEYIFAFAEQQADIVDYYFATWTTTQDFWNVVNDKEANKQRPVIETNITCEFIKHNKNLINFQLVKNFNTSPHPTFYHQTYLAKLANIMKRRYELDNDFVYTQVFEIRPDLYIFDRDINIPVILTDFEWSAEFSYKSKHVNQQWPSASDLYYQANSFGNDIMAERYYYQKSMEAIKVSGTNKIKHWGYVLHNNHWILLDYSYARRMQAIPLVTPFCKIPIRPNFPQDDLRKYSYNELWGYAEQYCNSLNNCT